MDRADKVRAFFRYNPSTLILLSGGVDSAVLALLASEGAPGKIKALTFRTPLVKGDEIEMAEAVAEMLEIDLHIKDIDVTSDPHVYANPGDRCYFCRKVLHGEAARHAITAGLTGIADGVQAEEIDEHRPGVRAAAEDGILHPLADAGLTKSEIRELARTAGLPNSERPAAPCIATRFPPGVPISRTWIDRLQRGEAFLAREGFENSRIRLFPPGLAAIEIEAHEMPRFWEIRERVFETLHEIGFPVVSLDIEGLKRGKMERFLEVE